MKYSYKVAGKEVVLESDDDLVAVRFSEPAAHSTRARVVKETGLGAFSARYEVPKEPFTVIRVAQTPEPRPERCAAAISRLAASADVDRVSRVFQRGELGVLATNRVLVGLSDTAQSQPLFKKYGARVLHERDGEYQLELAATADPLEVASKLAQEPAVTYAEPDFVTFGKHLARRVGQVSASAISPSDPETPKQYAIRITSAVNAWELQKGKSSVVIAVLDEGVDTAHEDLAACIVGAYDGSDDDAFQEPNPWDGHGTACAGLACAIHDNDRGIQGIGGGCGLLAVRIAYSPSNGAPWQTSNSWIARSIDFAWEHGASVLSNSWGGGAPSNAIVNAFERARQQGRGGKGCVVVVAAGNASGPVTFPGDLPNVLTVSASNEFDQFKTKTSSDGENWWGSNFGPEVDVAAPGVHNWTTDISGAGGYTPNNYTDFNGTSSATPIVAGACGLVLSANPELTESQVRAIIRDSADKIGQFAYVDNRNDQFGYGRLNCRAAVQLAIPEAPSYTALHRATQTVPIRDLQTAQLAVSVGDERPIADIQVHVDVAHTWIGDLEVTLLPPNKQGAQPVVLQSRVGGSADNIQRTFDTTSTPDLKALLGKTLPGTWSLRVTDKATQDTGAILSFAVELQF